MSCSSSASTCSLSLRRSFRPRSSSPLATPSLPRCSPETPPTPCPAAFSLARGVPVPSRWPAPTRSIASGHGLSLASLPLSCCSSSLSTLSSWSTPAAGSQKATVRPAVPTARSDLLWMLLEVRRRSLHLAGFRPVERFFLPVFRPTCPRVLHVFGASVGL